MALKPGSSEKEFYYNTSPLSYCNDKICIYGSMGSAHITEASVIILPKNHADLAPAPKQTVSAQSWNQAMTNLASNSKWTAKFLICDSNSIHDFPVKIW